MFKIAKFISIAALLLISMALPVFAQGMQSGSGAHSAASLPSTKIHVARSAVRRIHTRRGTRLYDGAWSVVIETTRGDCPAAVRAAVHIIEGRLMADDLGYQVDGHIARGGAIRVIVSAAGKGASGFGRLSHRGGGGRWRTWSGDCSGLWTAERRSL